MIGNFWKMRTGRTGGERADGQMGGGRGADEGLGRTRGPGADGLMGGLHVE